MLNRIRVARDYALKLPMANGKLGVTGFCAGGGLAWESAAEIEGVNVSVVFYGGPPAEAVMARIQAPVAAFFGTNDLGLAPGIAPATADMKRLGKNSTCTSMRKRRTYFSIARIWEETGRRLETRGRRRWPSSRSTFGNLVGTPLV